jgi:hypothetical protein
MGIKQLHLEIFLSTLCLLMGVYLVFLRLFLILPPLKAQCTDITNPRFNNGLLTTPTSPPTTRFGGTNNGNPGPCVVDPNAAILATFQLPTFTELHRNFFEKASIDFLNTYQIDKTTSSCTPLQPADNSTLRFVNRDQLMDFPCDMNLNGNPNPASNRSGVVFIEGNLYINSNSLYPGSDRGVIYVVRNNVYISRTVTTVDGVIISGGIIHTSCFTTTICGRDSLPTTSQLLINGNLVSLNAATPIIFDRDLTFTGLGNSLPAEKIISDSKYLALFRQIFSATLSVQSEDTNFASR